MPRFIYENSLLFRGLISIYLVREFGNIMQKVVLQYFVANENVSEQQESHNDIHKKNIGIHHMRPHPEPLTSDLISLQLGSKMLEFLLSLSIDKTQY